MVSWEECGTGVVGACRPDNGRHQRLRNHVQCSRLERWSDQVLPKNRRHIFRRLENSLPRTKSTTRPRERGVKTTSPVIHRKNAILSVLETFILHLSVTFRFVGYSEIEPSPYSRGRNHRCVCSWAPRPASTSPVPPTRCADSKKNGEIE